MGTAGSGARRASDGGSKVTSQAASLHEAHADVPVQRRTVDSCKECRAQEVAAWESIEGFRHFRLPDGGAEE